MMKKLLASLMVAVMILTAAPLSGFVGLDLLHFNALASAAYSTCGDNLTHTFNEQTGELVIQGTGAMYNFVFDDNIYCPPWETYKDSIKSVVIGDGITTIGDCAFSRCENLTSVKIGTGVTSIGEYAFDVCKSLSEITIPTNVKTIGNEAFGYCENLTSITIPDSVKTLGKGVFLYCRKLASVTIGNGVTKIDENTFESCDSLESIVIPDNVTSIGHHAFYYCTNLNSITIGKGVATIADRAFYRCSKLSRTVVDEENLYYSSDSYGVLFNKDKTKIIHYPDGSDNTSYIIPDSVTSIDEETFEECLKLKSVVIGNGVTKIGERAFSGCANLENVIFGKSVTTIGSRAFASCEKLKDVIIPESVTTINSYAFTSCQSLTNVTIPDSVTTIGREAFWKCESLTNVTIGSGVTSIGDLTFRNCDSLRNISVDSDNQYYSSDAFGVLYNKSKTKLIQYPIGNDRKSFTVPEGVTSIEMYSFWGSKLSKVIISDSIKTIGYSAFYACDELTDVIIGDGVTTIGESAFNTCINLANLKIGTSVNTIGKSAFAYNDLTDLIIPNSVTTIEDGAFEDSKFTSITIGNGVTKIGVAAFNYCDYLETVYFCGTEEEWDAITVGTRNTKLLSATIHFIDHICEYSEWIILKEPSATESGVKKRICEVCEEAETVVLPATGFEMAEGVAIDYATNTISGFNAGEMSLDGYTTTVNDNYTWEYETENGKLGTGSKAILKDGDTVIGEYTVLVYGDTTGDSWYDGQDAIIVDCLANGMLTKEDVGEVVYTAADCNHDGVIDQLDVALLNEAGMLLTNVDQSKPADVLLETSAEYVEYLDLIDQSPEIEIEDETEDTTPEQDAEVDIFGMIINFIKSIFEMIFSHIPVPFN